jgi:hypothetical protein
MRSIMGVPMRRVGIRMSRLRMRIVLSRRCIHFGSIYEMDRKFLEVDDIDMVFKNS